jgi:hypothetical protein
MLIYPFGRTYGDMRSVQPTMNDTSFQKYIIADHACRDVYILLYQAGTRGLISPEFSLVGMKSLRIQLDTCFNRTQNFIDPILVQFSSNNGILWETLITIIYEKELPNKSWLIELPNDEVMQLYLIRIRLFQRVSTSMSNRIIN